MRPPELPRKSRQRVMLTQYSTMAFSLFISVIAFTAACKLPSYTLALFLVNYDPDQKSLLLVISTEYVEMECDAGNARNYSLDGAHKEHADSVIIRNCPLPGDTSFVSRFENLNLTKARLLEFESSESDANLARHHLSDLQNLEYLSLNFTNLTHMAEDLFADLSNLTLLQLNVNNLSLTEKLFEPLKSVKYLEIVYSNLQTLPPGIFKNQHKLFHLNLTGNQLHNFTKNLIENATSLGNIDLSVNNMETFDPDVFQPLTNLRIIYVKENMLTTLPEKLLIEQHELRFLDLSHNRLQTLPDRFFHSTTNLKKLWLSYNQLNEISDELFVHLFYLEILYLDSNNLHTITADAFCNLSYLKVLNLANNKIYLFEISYSEVLQKSISTFIYLFELEELNLRNNSMRYMVSDWKTELLKLQNLDLSYNEVTILHDYDLLFNNSVQVNLENNLIHEIYFTSIHFINGPFANGVQRIYLNNNPLHCDCRLLFFLQFLRGEYEEKFENQIEVITKNLKCEGPPNLFNKHIDNLSYMELVCPLDDSASMENRCPPACECWKRPYDQMLLVNCSNSNISRIPTLPQEPLLKGIELYVENNNIDRLPLGNTAGYADVKRIYAAGNRLHQLEAKNLPKGLQYLDVRRNMLRRLSMRLLNFFNNSFILNGLFLSQNAWICDCEAKPLLEFTQSAAVLQKLLQEQDFNQMRCAADATRPQDMQYFKDISVADICPPKFGLIIALGIFIALLGIMVGICLALFYKYNQEIKVVLYAHNWCLWFVTEEELDKDKRYDAFVSYTHKDEAFIADYLVPELEHGPIPFKLCIHVRDFIVGGCIPEQILRAVDESRRTIIVLSQNFIDSTWGRLEFRAAHQSSLNEKRNRLIVIIYGDIENMDNLDNELQLYVKTNTYLKWDDPHFWNKLRYAMPHRNGKRKGSLERSAMKGSIDDGLELGTPSPITPAGSREH